MCVWLLMVLHRCVIIYGSVCVYDYLRFCMCVWLLMVMYVCITTYGSVCVYDYVYTCKFMTNCSAIHIKGPKLSFNVTQPFTCISKNIVYGIICKRCNIIYIGETGRRLADRITEHIRSIRNNFSGFPVAQHFNPPSHCSLNDFSVTGIIHCNCSNVNRLNIENRIIFKLGTLSPLGLNTKFDAFSLT